MTQLNSYAPVGITNAQMHLLTKEMNSFFEVETEKLFTKISQLTAESDCTDMRHAVKQLLPFSDSQLLKAAEKFKSGSAEFLLVRRLWEHRLKKQ